MIWRRGRPAAEACDMANLPVTRQHGWSGERTGPDPRATATETLLRLPAETVDPLALPTPRSRRVSAVFPHLFQTSTAAS
ncbi:hypothetical protein GCM10017752_09180 [Streptomyces roseoviridis]